MDDFEPPASDAYPRRALVRRVVVVGRAKRELRTAGLKADVAGVDERRNRAAVLVAAAIVTKEKLRLGVDGQEK